MSWELHHADILEGLPLEDQSVHCVVTSPPYWGLRDYQVDGQLGLEPTPEEHIENMLAVFREVWRVLRDDGTCWMNYGDAYNASPPRVGFGDQADNSVIEKDRKHLRPKIDGLKPKDLIGMPWRLAFALQADGWYLRSDIVWSKPNPMPESVTDRPTRAHEYVFLLTKKPRYFYDPDAVRKPTSRNLRTVWTIPTQPYAKAHFATYPEALVVPCIKAGTSERGVCSECAAPFKRKVHVEGGTIGKDWDNVRDEMKKGRQKEHKPGYKRNTIGWEQTCDCNDPEAVPATVLDPFCGSATTGVVANKLKRHFVGVDISEEYLDLAEERLTAGEWGVKVKREEEHAIPGFFGKE